MAAATGGKVGTADVVGGVVVVVVVVVAVVLLAVAVVDGAEDDVDAGEDVDGAAVVTGGNDVAVDPGSAVGAGSSDPPQEAARTIAASASVHFLCTPFAAMGPRYPLLR